MFLSAPTVNHMYLEKLGEPRELDGLHVELGEDGVHGAVVVDLGLEADELERRLGHLEDRKGVRLGHLLHLLHDLPVGDLGACRVSIQLTFFTLSNFWAHNWVIFGDFMRYFRQSCSCVQCAVLTALIW